MNNCLECGKEVPQTAGKRKKEYCGNNCRVKYYLKKKNKGKPKGKQGRPKGAKNKVKESSISDKQLVEIAETATEKIDGIKFDTHIYLAYDVKPQSEWGSEMNAMAIPEIKPHTDAIKEALNELETFGTATIKTELIDGKVSTKVVDKKKIVNDEKDWKPKLSPYMQSRQKSKQNKNG